MEPTPRTRPARGPLLALLVPLALAALGYSRSLHGELQFDDLPGIAENPAVKASWHWLRTAPLGERVFGRPLTTLTFAANYAAGRLDPFGYHAVNVALHLAVVLLVAALALRVATLAGAERPRWIALGVAGLFAVHPLHSQAVSYVSQRAEILASGLYVATLLLLLARDPDSGPRPWGLWGAALATFLLGFAAKAIVVTLPAAWVAIRLAAAPAATPDAGRGWRRSLPALASVTLAAAALGAAFLASLRGAPDAGPSVAGTTPWLYLLTQLRACVVHLRLLVFPVGQSVDWVFPTSPGLSDPATLGAALAILAVAAAAVLLLVRGRRHATPGGATARLAGLGLAWFFILLSATSSVVPLADNLVEHRVYLASWGILLAAVVGADALSARLGAHRLAVGAWLLLLVVLTVALFERNAVWETKETLWSDVVARFPESARARMNLGHALDDQQRFEEAIRQYRLALDYAGGNAARRGQILLDLGAAQVAAGRPEDGRRSFEEGLHFLPEDDRLLANLAMLAGASGAGPAAESYALRALRAKPAQPLGWVALGNVALERGSWPSALDAYGRAVAIDPDRGDAHYGRALALRMLGRRADECAALRDALRARLLPAYRGEVEGALRERCR